MSVVDNLMTDEESMLSGAVWHLNAWDGWEEGEREGGGIKAMCS